MKFYFKKIYLYIKKKLFDGKHIHKTALVKNSLFSSYVHVGKNATILNSKINDYTSIGRSTNIMNVDMGKYCSVSWNVTIGATSHPVSHLTTHAFPYISNFGFSNADKRIKQKTIIKNDVWIGTNSIIMPGLTIGNGAIIGAGAVVTKDVLDYEIVAGVPAKTIKYRFSKEIIQQLIDLQWWNLEPQIIKKHINLWGGEFNCNSLKRLEEICKS